MSAREDARAIWQAVLAAADPAPLVRAHLAALPAARHILVLGCGKASGAMARAAEEVLGARIAAGFVVVKDGYTVPLARVRLTEAGHPVPDARGLAASARLLELAHGADEDDLILFLVSGGGSAPPRAPAPPRGGPAGGRRAPGRTPCSCSGSGAAARRCRRRPRRRSRSPRRAR